jgi:hypothetical protein
MAETVFVSVASVLLVVILGTGLYVLVSRMRAAQDRRDYAAADRESLHPGDPQARREPPESGDRAT